MQGLVGGQRGCRPGATAQVEGPFRSLIGCERIERPTQPVEPRVRQQSGIQGCPPPVRHGKIRAPWEHGAPLVPPARRVSERGGRAASGWSWWQGCSPSARSERVAVSSLVTPLAWPVGVALEPSWAGGRLPVAASLLPAGLRTPEAQILAAPRAAATGERARTLTAPPAQPWVRRVPVAPMSFAKRFLFAARRCGMQTACGPLRSCAAAPAASGLAVLGELAVLERLAAWAVELPVALLDVPAPEALPWSGCPRATASTAPR
jgi:hypothetical protein